MKRKNARPLNFQMTSEADKGNDIWLTTLSDLLMLLVIFFVILFSIELQKQALNVPGRTDVKEQHIEKRENTVLADSSIPNRTASIEKDLIAVLNSGIVRQDIAVKREANLVTLTFPERIVFDPGHAQLKSSARETLEKIAAFIKERPYLIIEVQGHTDDMPINNARYPSNWELSVDRATQVAKALIGMGLNPSQFSVKGFGEYRAIFPNDTDENRLKNRRVEIQFSIPPQ